MITVMTDIPTKRETNKTKRGDITKNIMKEKFSKPKKTGLHIPF
jgi:hypothetical protein